MNTSSLLVLAVVLAVTLFLLFKCTNPEGYGAERREEHGAEYDDDDDESFGTESFRGGRGGGGMRGGGGGGMRGGGRGGMRGGRGGWGGWGGWRGGHSYGRWRYPYGWRYSAPQWWYDPTYYVAEYPQIDEDPCKCLDKYRNCVDFERRHGKNTEDAKRECEGPLRRCVDATQEGLPCP